MDVPRPVIDEKQNPADADCVIIKVHYAGICGTDRGIWNRQAFKDAILGSVEAEVNAGRKHRSDAYRIIGHEFFGEVAEVGSKVEHIATGDFVACESHVVCNRCYQCVRGQKEVCTNEKILGISQDGGFAEFTKVPQHIVWKTDTSKIRPEIAAMQEPFGNAVHAASKVDAKGKSVAIFGLGPIGMFLLLVLKGQGAAFIIGVEPNPVAAEMARKLGIDYVVPLRNTKMTKYEIEKPYVHNPEVTDEIMEITKGVGVDISFEMAGFNSSVNNCLYATRRGGEIILFGIKQGDFVFEDYNRLIVRGFTMHAVIGRQLWRTWEETRRLFEDVSNGVQRSLWTVMLKQGQGTILSINDYTKEKFEKMMAQNPKFLLQF